MRGFPFMPSLLGQYPAGTTSIVMAIERVWPAQRLPKTEMRTGPWLSSSPSSQMLQPFLSLNLRMARGGLSQVKKARCLEPLPGQTPLRPQILCNPVALGAAQGREVTWTAPDIEQPWAWRYTHE